MTEGFDFKTAKRTITESDLTTFINLGGLNEPLFYDASHAAAGGYRGRLVPGALIYCIAEGLIVQTNFLNGTGLAFMHMELSVKRPVFVGDTLLALCTVTESRASSKPGRGVVSATVSVRNQHDDEVLVYTPVRLIRGADFIEGDD
ncbi:MaoC family dehydratase [Mycolicibacterium arenosum]|uniref:MaoC family dehydratase N-terminal domain-containing protein n=1 Tax=Mycolicibacterium arenosum TaxID=2952157 RepID=A0ABT1LWC2_9MYCO|nr:MaoC family dehydratase N-terminal domain-containing protein [Mycolicibacterium sp. CAU 1645]MCP9271193.1 MaoC family dehydratase N-terminal domain-containing protein [Mycolicibacterium sp. CAU 1645]